MILKIDVFQSEASGGGNEVFGGVFCVPWGPWGPQGECANFFVGSWGALWSGQSLNHDGF